MEYLKHSISEGIWYLGNGQCCQTLLTQVMNPLVLILFFDFTI
jgi:hypothetical protein